MGTYRSTILLVALCSSAQMISYEVSIGFIIMNMCICAVSFNLSSIMLAQQTFTLLSMLIILCFSFLSETNRHPLDLPEDEAEIKIFNLTEPYLLLKSMVLYSYK